MGTPDRLFGPQEMSVGKGIGKAAERGHRRTLDKLGAVGGILASFEGLVLFAVAIALALCLVGAGAVAAATINPGDIRVTSDTAAQARVSEGYGRLPLHFEANRGQTDPQVKFLSRGTGHILFLTPTAAVLVSTKPESTTNGTPETREQTAGTVLRLTFLGANPQPHVAGQGELPGKANYFIGNDPAKWQVNVPT